MPLSRILPAVLLPWIVYHALVLIFHSAFAADPVALLNRGAVSVPLMGGGAWTISIGDIVVALTVATGFIEVLKSSSIARGQMLDYVLSAILFATVLIEFLYYSWAQTSVFFFMVLALFLDLVIGYTISVRVARRDLAVGRFGA